MILPDADDAPDVPTGTAGRDAAADHGLDPAWVWRLVAVALDEDLGPAPGRDVTSQATIDPEARGVAHLMARQPGVVAGLVTVAEVLDQVAERLGSAPVDVELHAADGEEVSRGQVLAVLRGPVLVLLVAERTMLNIASRASGVATHTHAWTRVLAETVGPDGRRAQVLDTRKTTPGLRALEKYAVRCGGGTNKRMGLFDVAMVKDNHVVAAGSVTAAVHKVQEAFPGVDIQVEADTRAQALEALDAGARFLLLDNMSTAQLSEVVVAVRAWEQAAASGLGSDEPAPRVELEATGNLTLERAREVAATGVDHLSVGALTHSSPILDLALDLVERG